MSHQYPKQPSLHHLGNMNTSKYPLALTQAPAYFHKLIIGVLKDFPFTITYLDDIINFSRTTKEHLDHIIQVFRKLWNTQLSMKLSKCHFFAKEIQYLGTHTQHHWHQGTTTKNPSHQHHAPTKNC